MGSLLFNLNELNNGLANISEQANQAMNEANNAQVAIQAWRKAGKGIILPDGNQDIDKLIDDLGLKQDATR